MKEGVHSQPSLPRIVPNQLTSEPAEKSKSVPRRLPSASRFPSRFVQEMSPTTPRRKLSICQLKPIWPPANTPLESSSNSESRILKPSSHLPPKQFMSTGYSKSPPATPACTPIKNPVQSE